MPSPPPLSVAVKRRLEEELPVPTVPAPPGASQSGHPGSTSTLGSPPSTPAPEFIKRERELATVVINLAPSVRLSVQRPSGGGPPPRRLFLPVETSLSSVRDTVAKKLIERNPEAEFFVELETKKGRGEVLESHTLGEVLKGGEDEVSLWLCQREDADIWA